MVGHSFIQHWIPSSAPHLILKTNNIRGMRRYPVISILEMGNENLPTEVREVDPGALCWESNFFLSLCNFTLMLHPFSLSLAPFGHQDNSYVIFCI